MIIFFKLIELISKSFLDNFLNLFLRSLAVSFYSRCHSFSFSKKKNHTRVNFSDSNPIFYYLTKRKSLLIYGNVHKL